MLEWHKKIRVADTPEGRRCFVACFPKGVRSYLPCLLLLGAATCHACFPVRLVGAASPTGVEKRLQLELG
ncbi:MAG: hypothetical protein PUP91_14050 [Rhizonema sp. PD37]|nr:hypothetical protein [Rhizonema sp. PD37]